VRTPEGETSSPLAFEVTDRTYNFEPNEQGYETISFDFGDDRCSVHIRNKHGEHRLACGLDGSWPRTRTAFSGAAPETIAASGKWTLHDTLTLRICHIETPFCPTITCRFEAERLLLDYRPNVSFQSEPPPQLVGHA
jgi:hypothetical protein